MRKYSLHAKKVSKVELQLQLEAEEAGYTVTARGWPDFILRRDDEVLFVEVKNKGEKLSEQQLSLFLNLKDLGIEVWIAVDGSFFHLMPFSEFLEAHQLDHRKWPFRTKKVSDTKTCQLDRRERPFRTKNATDVEMRRRLHALRQARKARRH